MTGSLPPAADRAGRPGAADAAGPGRSGAGQRTVPP
jgi:hypothetical protein